DVGPAPAGPRGAREPLRPRALTRRARRDRHRPGDSLTVDVERAVEISTGILDEVERAVVGKRDALELVLLGMLADGHVLLEDYPGLAKTLIARSFAQVTEIGF